MKAKVNYEFKFKETSAFWIAYDGYELRRDLEHNSNTKTPIALIASTLKDFILTFHILI